MKCIELSQQSLDFKPNDLCLDLTTDQDVIDLIKSHWLTWVTAWKQPGETESNAAQKAKGPSITSQTINPLLISLLLAYRIPPTLANRDR